MLWNALAVTAHLVWAAAKGAAARLPAVTTVGCAALLVRLYANHFAAAGQNLREDRREANSNLGAARVRPWAAPPSALVFVAATRL